MQIKTVAPVAGDKLALRKANDRSRSEDQQAIDQELGRTVGAYQKAGGPKVPVANRPRVAFAVAPAEQAELKAMLRRAANLHKIAPLFFEDSVNDNGEAVVTLTIGPVPPKKH